MTNRNRRNKYNATFGYEWRRRQFLRAFNDAARKLTSLMQRYTHEFEATADAAGQAVELLKVMFDAFEFTDDDGSVLTADAIITGV